jgi:hypothetical protein
MPLTCCFPNNNECTLLPGGCYYFSTSNDIPNLVLGANLLLGVGKVDILGNGELAVTCRMNPGADKQLGTVKQVFSIAAGCLDGESNVATPVGPRKVKKLSVGDKVLAQNPITGAMEYDDVVFTPHKNAGRLTLYQDIKATVPAVQESRRLQVTATHYVPAGPGGKAFKLAKDVKVSKLGFTKPALLLGQPVACCQQLASWLPLIG